MVTFHNDIARSGQNLSETILTPKNVQTPDFGKITFLPVGGKVDAQPLYLSNVTIPGQGMHAVIYVVAEDDTVYAFDADKGESLWHVSLLGAGEGTSDSRSCDEELNPQIGITATPVIDRAQGRASS